MINVEKTTYLADGIQEPCFEVSNGYAMVRISTCYHYLGHNTLYVTIFLDGEWNGEEEVAGDFNALTFMEAKRIAKQNCAYLY